MDAMYEHCTAVLIPTIELKGKSKAVHNAWLNLVTQSSFDEVSKKLGVDTGGSGSLPIEGIPVGFSGFFKGSWEDFKQKRQDYLSANQGVYDEATTFALFRQSLTPKQVAGWTKCVTQNQVGLFVRLFDDSETSVTAEISYRGVPETTQKVKVTISNGSTTNKEKTLYLTLANGGQQQLDILRASATAAIKVIANAPQMATSAVSIWPLPTPSPDPIVVPPHLPPPPALISKDRPVTASRGVGHAAVVDGNLQSAWNAQYFAPQWIQVSLDGPHDIAHLRLYVEQQPAGMTRHLIRGIRSSGEEILIEDHQSFTGAGSELVILVDQNGEGRDITAIRIETMQSPSWVAWREIEVFGWKSKPE